VNIKKDSLFSANKIGDYVTLITDLKEGCIEYEGIISEINENFIMLVSVKEWKEDGIQIFSLDHVDKLEYSNIQQCQQKIVNWNGVVLSEKYNWLNLADYEKIFNSFKNKDIIVALRDSDSIWVGKILNASITEVVLITINPIGNWNGRKTVLYEDILHICADCEYANVFEKYADYCKELKEF